MAKFKGDYYTIDHDETEVGGALKIMNTYHDWKAALAAWERESEPEFGCLWLVRRNSSDHSGDVHTIFCKGPDQPKGLEMMAALVEAAEAAGAKIRMVGKKSTRH